MKQSERLKLQIQKEREREKLKAQKKQEQAKAKELKIQLKDIKLKRSKLSLNFYKDIFKKRDHSKLIVINMELKNGNHTTFYVAESDDSFKYKGNRYIFDPVLKYYNIDFQSYCYDYHEGFDLPIRRQFPINDTKTALSESGMIETEYATNPTTLERFMNSSIIEMMLRGGAIDKTLKMIVVIAVLTGLIALAHLLLFMNENGMFENIGG